VLWTGCIRADRVHQGGQGASGWISFFIAHLFFSWFCLRLQVWWEEKNPILVGLLERTGPYHYLVTETISQIRFNYLSTIEAISLTFNTFPSTCVQLAFVLHDSQQISLKLACRCSYYTHTRQSYLRFILYRLTSTSDKENIAKNIWPNTWGGMLASQME
jgi:hypothetical protein